LLGLGQCQSNLIHFSRERQNARPCRAGPATPTVADGASWPDSPKDPQWDEFRLCSTITSIERLDSDANRSALEAAATGPKPDEAAGP
jgi:hypothetical protein